MEIVETSGIFGVSFFQYQGTYIIVDWLCEKSASLCGVTRDLIINNNFLEITFFEEIDYIKTIFY